MYNRFWYRNHYRYTYFFYYFWRSLCSSGVPLSENRWVSYIFLHKASFCICIYVHTQMHNIWNNMYMHYFWLTLYYKLSTSDFLWVCYIYTPNSLCQIFLEPIVLFLLIWSILLWYIRITRILEKYNGMSDLVSDCVRLKSTHCILLFAAFTAVHIVIAL